MHGCCGEWVNGGCRVGERSVARLVAAGMASGARVTMGGVQVAEGDAAARRGATRLAVPVTVRRSGIERR